MNEALKALEWFNSHEWGFECQDHVSVIRAALHAQGGEVPLGYEVMGDTLFFGTRRPDGVKLEEIWYTVDLAGYKPEYKETAIKRAEFLGAVYCSGKQNFRQPEGN